MEPTRCILPRLWAVLWVAAALPAWGQGSKPPELQPETLGVMPAVSAGERVYVADIAISHIADGRLRVFDARSGRFVGMLASGYAGNFSLSNKADELYIATTYLSRGGRGERTDLLEVYDTASLSFKYEVVLPPKRAQALNYRGLVRASGDGRFVLLRHGWCGHLCPVGAFYGLLGHFGRLHVAAPRAAACTHCGDCFETCPVPQVIVPVLPPQPRTAMTIADVDCLRCGRCIDRCGERVFEWRIGPAD